MAELFDISRKCFFSQIQWRQLVIHCQCLDILTAELPKGFPHMSNIITANILKPRKLKQLLKAVVPIDVTEINDV